MVGQDKGGHMVWRVVAPPASPCLVPWPVAGAKHLAAHDVGSDILDDLGGDFRVGALLAALQALLCAPAGGLEDPLVQAQSPFADRVLKALIGPGDETVERDRDLAGNGTHALMTPIGGQNNRSHLYLCVSIDHLSHPTVRERPASPDACT